jgi:hypothetical protein
MHPHVLQLDIQGTPQAWISLEQAVLHYATGSVAWEDGDLPLATLRGGFNVARGVQSRIEVAPIIALRGASKINLFDVVPGVTKEQAGAPRPPHLRILRGRVRTSAICNASTCCPSRAAVRGPGPTW